MAAGLLKNKFLKKNSTSDSFFKLKRDGGPEYPGYPPPARMRI